jgi:carbonic anhydrase/acetyltransferase-like protein (isoleucine patch superfamily)
MPLYALGDLTPQLGEGAWAAPSADLIADVRLGPRSSVWFGAVIRADNTPIIIGEDSNIQDGSMCHSDADFPLTIGARVTVGHHAILHGCTIADDCLIGMGARILNGAMIEPECIVGAGALITEGKHFERGSLIVGTPGRVVRQLTGEEREMLRASAAHYAEKAARCTETLRQLDSNILSPWA